MDNQLYSLESDMANYQKVKEVVLNKLVDEGLLNEDDANEFNERCQVLLYKGTWFSKWFDKNVKTEKPEADKKGWYIRMVEMKERENEVDRLMRRTTGDYE
jgi:polyhydroxyalkanoate synthesis regulator phasin